MRNRPIISGFGRVKAILPSQLASAWPIHKVFSKCFFPHGLVSPFRAESDLRLGFIKSSTDRYTIAKGGTACQVNYTDGHTLFVYNFSCMFRIQGRWGHDLAAKRGPCRNPSIYFSIFHQITSGSWSLLRPYQTLYN